MRKTVSIIAALSVSLFVYVFYRSEKTLVNELLILIFSFDRYMTLKDFITAAVPLSEPVIFSLPGGLWVFCVTALSQNFYMSINGHRIQLYVFPVLFATGLEFCQLLHLTNGRFDLWDIAFYLLFSLLAYCSFRPRCRQQNILSPFTLDGFICLACFLSVYLAHVSR